MPFGIYKGSAEMARDAVYGSLAEVQEKTAQALRVRRNIPDYGWQLETNNNIIAKGSGSIKGSFINKRV